MTHQNSPFAIVDSITYAADSIVSRQITSNAAGNITLFAFDAGQQLSEHTAPYEAVVQVVDGEAEITLNGEIHIVRAGEMLIMPANAPHALRALKPFKMILTMIKGS